MKTLLQRAQSGDADAFAVLFQQHAPALWRTAQAVLQDEYSAADALQETAIKAWRTLPSFAGKSSLSTWLVRILLNTCFDEQRSRQRVIPFEDLSSEECNKPDAEGPPLNIRPFPTVEDAIRKLDTTATLASLNESDRAILVLFYVNDLSLREIAAAMGIAEGAARTRLCRARARFKDAYLKADQAKDDPSVADTPRKELIS